MFLHLSFVIRFWLWWLSHSVMSNSCNLVGYSLTGSSVHGILQERILEWVSVPFSRGSSQPME